MVLSTNQKGAIAETAIAHAAVKLGIEVYRPVAEGGRFDLIFAFADASLARVQCKWAPLVNGTIAIRAYSARRAAEGFRYRTYTASEIDAIAAYNPDTDACYLRSGRARDRTPGPAPQTEAGEKQSSRPGKLASSYELGAIAQLGERSAGSRKVGGSSPPSSISERAA